MVWNVHLLCENESRLDVLMSHVSRYQLVAPTIFIFSPSNPVLLPHVLHIGGQTRVVDRNAKPLSLVVGIKKEAIDGRRLGHTHCFPVGVL